MWFNRCPYKKARLDIQKDSSDVRVQRKGSVRTWGEAGHVEARERDLRSNQMG